MSGHYTYEIIPLARIGAIEPMWLKLNEISFDVSPFFKDHYKNQSFESRYNRIVAKGDDAVRIEIARDDSGCPAAYCVSSLCPESEGEVDSLFIESRHRKSGLGGSLLDRAVEWLTTAGADRVKLCIVYGNEPLLDFYARHSFFPRLTYLYHSPRPE